MNISPTRLQTPCQPCLLSYGALPVKIIVKRDDLYPLSGGGNKGRKMRTIIEAIRKREANALVSCGGMQSNHARAVALTAASQGWPCRLILHGNPACLRKPTGNLLLMTLCGADIVAVPPDCIAAEIEKAMSIFRSEGLSPYEIPGGGHSIEGAMAYADAVDELAEQINPSPDFIVLASGTGTTQAGLLAGIERRNWSTRVLGISVARRNPRGAHVVQAAYEEVRSFLHLDAPPRKVEFFDDFIGDGYEKPYAAVMNVVRRTAAASGIILDPTYTGKAFHGMTELVRSGIIPSTSRIVFWHTGGLLNLCASSEMWSISQVL